MFLNFALHNHKMSIFKKLFKKESKKDNQFIDLEVISIIRETPNAVTLVFNKPNSGFDFQSGQYLTLKTSIEGKEVRRAYSLCSLPEEDQLRVTVKETENGFFSKFVNQNCEVGHVFQVMRPMGNFTFTPKASETRHIVAFAGGSGITPIFSIISNGLKHEPNSRFTLIYGNRSTEDIIFHKQIEKLHLEHPSRFEIVHILSEVPNEELTTYSGLVTKELVHQFSTIYFDVNLIDSVYLCGPGPMIIGVEESLIETGLPSKKIHKELFTTPLEDDSKASSDSTDGIVIPAKLKATCQGEQYDLTISDKKKTVLDTALDAGIKAPFSCLNGVCSTCSARLTKGTVTMNQNFTLEEDEIKEGYILTCQSHPTSPELEVNWDNHRI